MSQTRSPSQPKPQSSGATSWARPRPPKGVWLALVALSATLSSSAVAQERVAEEQWRRGYHGFAAMCRVVGLTPTTDQNAWRRMPPRETVLVAFGAFERFPVSDIESYVRRGGALLVATDRGDRGQIRLAGLDLLRGPLQAAQADAAFQEFPDCPVVSNFEDHPLTHGLLSVATNRPGAMYTRAGRFAGARWRTLARLPRLQITVGTIDLETTSGPPFLAALESPAGGRAVVAADQTVFANQMLFYEDNAQLAANMLRWLNGTGRTTVLIIDDQTVIAPPLPEDVEVEIPPPTPEQVLDAVRQLPPEARIAFANAVVANLEDAGIPNEFLAFLMEQIPALQYRRLLLLLPTLLLGLVLFRRLISEAPLDGSAAAERQSAEFGLAPQQRAAQERQQAARELLDRFRADIAGSSSVPWPVFAARLTWNKQWLNTRLRRYALNQSTRRLAPSQHRYWTRRRLRTLDQRLRAWRRARTSGELSYRGHETR